MFNFSPHTFIYIYNSAFGLCVVVLMNNARLKCLKYSTVKKLLKKVFSTNNVNGLRICRF